MTAKGFFLSCLSVLSFATFGECDYFLGTFNAFKFIHDPKFLPTAEAEGAKLNAMAQLISAMNEGRGPDLMAFVETDAAFLKRLTKHPQIASQNILNHGVAEQGDDRGNNLGLISRFPLKEKPSTHIYWDEKDPLWDFRKAFTRKRFQEGLLTRPIVEYRLALPNGEELIVFVNHWPSKKLGDWSSLQRFQAAQYLKNYTDGILEKNPGANIMILGDFNSNPDGPEMKAALGVGNDAKLVNLEELHFNLREKVKDFKKSRDNRASPEEIKKFVKSIMKERGSYYYFHGDSWELFDQIVVSRNLLKYLVKDSYGPVRDSRFMTTDGIPNSFFHKNGKGISDHFPMAVRFRF